MHGVTFYPISPGACGPFWCRKRVCALLLFDAGLPASIAGLFKINHAMTFFYRPARQVFRCLRAVVFNHNDIPRVQRGDFFFWLPVTGKGRVYRLCRVSAFSSPYTLLILIDWLGQMRVNLLTSQRKSPPGSCAYPRKLRQINQYIAV